MFLKLFNKNKKENDIKREQETFCVNKMEENGKIYILRFKNGLWKFAESGNYPYQLGIATPLHTDQNGFPEKEENEQLLNMEQVLEREFAREDIAIFTGVIMGDGMKEFVFYTGKPKETSFIFEKLKKAIKHHELQYIIREDPTWEAYKTYGPRIKN